MRKRYATGPTAGAVSGWLHHCKAGQPGRTLIGKAGQSSALIGPVCQPPPYWIYSKTGNLFGM